MQLSHVLFSYVGFRINVGEIEKKTAPTMSILFPYIYIYTDTMEDCKRKRNL